jgi:hypothetical protein
VGFSQLSLAHFCFSIDLSKNVTVRYERPRADAGLMNFGKAVLEGEVSHCCRNVNNSWPGLRGWPQLSPKPNLLIAESRRFVMEFWNRRKNIEADRQEPPHDVMAKRTDEQQRDSINNSSVSSWNTVDAMISSVFLAVSPAIGTYIEQGVRMISKYGDYAAGLLSPARPEWQSKAKTFWDDSSSSPMEWMMKHFDTNADGHISPSELVNMTDILKHLSHLPQESWTVWFRREWPLMDWKVGLFLWRSFGGVLFILTLLTIIPGRLHGISARILRWPLLAIVYFLIVVELM